MERLRPTNGRLGLLATAPNQRQLSTSLPIQHEFSPHKRGDMQTNRVTPEHPTLPHGTGGETLVAEIPLTSSPIDKPKHVNRILEDYLRHYVGLRQTY